MTAEPIGQTIAPPAGKVIGFLGRSRRNSPPAFGRVTGPTKRPKGGRFRKMCSSPS